MYLIQPVVILLVVVQLFILVSAQLSVSDLAVTAGSEGVAVVEYVVALIEDSDILPENNDFLIRLALVESHYGEDDDTYPATGYSGGIWKLNQRGFADTQDLTSHPGLAQKYIQIEDFFGINWLTVTDVDLRKPLYSAIAASLFISNIPVPIPPAEDVTGQAKYWIDYYNPTGDSQLYHHLVYYYYGDPHLTVDLNGSDTPFKFEVTGDDGDIFTLFEENYIKINSELTSAEGNDKAKYVGKIAVFVFADSAPVIIDQTGIQINSQHFDWGTENRLPLGTVGHVSITKRLAEVHINGLVWLDVKRMENPKRQHLNVALNHIGTINSDTSGIIGDVSRSASIVEHDKQLVLTNPDGTTTFADIKRQEQSWKVVGHMPQALKDIIENKKVACLTC